MNRVSWKAGIVLPLVAINAWVTLLVFDYFQPLGSIFIVASLLAFILNYPIEYLQKYRINRELAVALILILVVAVVASCSILLTPIGIQQWQDGISYIPRWLESLNIKVQLLNNWVIQQELPLNLKLLITEQIGLLPKEIEYLGQEFLHFVLDIVDNIATIIFTFILAIYLLLDEGHILDNLLTLVPNTHKFSSVKIVKQRLQNFILGQMSLASIDGILITMILIALKVPFALLLGLGVSILALVPLGDIIGFTLVSSLVASQDLLLGGEVLALSVLVGQFVDQIIAPRLLGNFTGLSPVQILAALAIGAKIGGPLGLLLAVPIFGCVKDTLTLNKPIN